MTKHMFMLVFVFFNDTATTEIYTLSLHDALPICPVRLAVEVGVVGLVGPARDHRDDPFPAQGVEQPRSEEHTSELQSRQYLVCRLLLEKKNISVVVVTPTARSASRNWPVLFTGSC